MIARRQLLSAAAFGAGALFVAPGLALATVATDRRFVFIIQRGAADGLDIVRPTGDPAFASLRGGLIGEATGTKLDAMFTLHPRSSKSAGCMRSVRRCSYTPSPRPIAIDHISTDRTCSKPAARSPMRCAMAGSTGW